MKKISLKLLIPMLVLIMMQWAGSVYFYDFPQLFESQLINKFAISTVEFSLLYSVASAPNLVSNIFAAWIIDRVGLGLSAVLFSAQVFIGVFVCYLGIVMEKFQLLLVGRFLFGIGFDTTFLTQTMAVERWFGGRFMTLANGLCRSWVYLFAAVASYIQPGFYLESRGFQMPMFVYAVVAFGCFLSTAVFGYVHLKKKKMLEESKEKEAMESKFVFTDFAYLGFLPWLIAITLALISNCFFQVMNFSTDMLVKRFGLEYMEATNIGSLMSISSMVMIPIMSAFFNRYGKKGLGIIVSAIVALVTFGSMMFVPHGVDKNIILGFMIMVSIFRSIYTSCMWSCLLLSVPKQASTAFVALGATMQNVCMATFPLVFGKINANRDFASYQNSLLCLTMMALVCVFLSVVINFIDLTTDKMLHLPENEQRVAELKMEKINQFSNRKRMAQMKTDEEYQSMENVSFGSLNDKSTVG